MHQAARTRFLRWAGSFRRFGTVLALVGLSAGCAGNRRDPVIKATRAADQVWRTRADPGRLEDALQGYLTLNTRFPDDSRVLWRLVRQYTLMGDRDPDDATRHYATAKEFGLQCLMLQPSFSGLVTSRGGRVVGRAAAELTVEDRECLVWTVIAWSRWVQARGASGVGLDLEPIRALGNRGVEVGSEWGKGRAYHAQALALSLPPPSLGPDYKGAKAACDKAIAAAPGRLVTQVDCAERVLKPMGKAEAADRILRSVAEITPASNDVNLLENRIAVIRACRATGRPIPDFEGAPDASDAEAAPSGEGSGE